MCTEKNYSWNFFNKDFYPEAQAPTAMKENIFLELAFLFGSRSFQWGIFKL